MRRPCWDRRDSLAKTRAFHFGELPSRARALVFAHQFLSPSAEISRATRPRRPQLSRRNRLNSTKLPIKINQRSPRRLKPNTPDFEEKDGVLPIAISNDFAIENSRCINKSRSTARHFNLLFRVKPFRTLTFEDKKQFGAILVIVR